MAPEGVMEIGHGESIAIIHDQVLVSRVCIDIANLVPRGIISEAHAQNLIANLQSVSAGRLILRASGRLPVLPGMNMSALSDLSRDTGKAKMCEQGASLVEPPSMEIRDKPSTPDAEEPSSAVTNNGAAYTDGVCGSAPVIAHGSRPKAMPDGPVGDFLRRANGARIRVAASTAPTNSEPKICFAFHGDDLIATEDL